MFFIIPYDKHQRTYHSMSIKAVNKYMNNLNTNEKRDVMELDFGVMPEVLREEYLDCMMEFSQR